MTPPKFIRHAGKALLCLLLTSPLAHAGVVAYDFTATVSNLTYYAHTTENGPGPGTVLSSSNYAGSLISLGNQVHGHFFYDTSLGLFAGQPPIRPGDISAVYGGNTYAHALSDMRYTIGNGGVQFAAKETPVINIIDSPRPVKVDVIHMVAFGTNASGLQQEAGIDLIDSRGTALNSLALPGSLPQSAFTQMAVYNSYRYAGRDDDLNITMTITSLTPAAAPVPEPESWAMLLAGLALTGAIARRKLAARLQ